MRELDVNIKKKNDISSLERVPWPKIEPFGQIKRIWAFSPPVE